MAWRDVLCGELRAGDGGRRVTVAGWADTRRDHGGLVFVDLRDHTGKVQLVINPERSPAAAALVHEVRNEFVLQAEGEVVARTPELVNPNLPTGEIELQVDELRILSRSTPLPFQLDEENVEEIGGPPTPGIGFGAGIERLVIALEEEGVEAPPAPAIDAFLAVEPGAPRERVAAWLAELRRAGVAAETDYAGRSLKGQLTQARRLGAARVVVVGADEATVRTPGEADLTVGHDGIVSTLSP